MSNDRNTTTPGNDEHLVEVTTNQCCGVPDSDQVKTSLSVSQATRADESPDDLCWADLLKAQSDRVRQEIASHESRVDEFLERFEGSTGEVLLDMREAFVGMLRTAVVVDGERAFDSPRSRAIAHYSGQAIVYASFDKRVRSIQIAVCPHGIHWGGLTEVDRNYWEVDSTTSAESDFRRACEAGAGTVAELMYDHENFRRAASIEEFLTAQTFAEIVARKTDADPQDVWKEILYATGQILYENAKIVRKIMKLLAREDVVFENRLAPYLARVKKCSTPFLSTKTATASADKTNPG